ncbi:hypothetical protein HDU77_008698 [Chytriomyces hyalinus]|nr:hypothetical protein HDU77_008698 [Chytriomyces hyalinus]
MSLQYNLLALLFAIAQTALAHTPGSPDDHDHEEELSALGNVTLDACAALGEEIQYNQNLHIGGIFILLAVSGLGVISTSMLSKLKMPMVSKLLLIFKMFGIGVLASTAWMHILPSAFEDFGNPCLDAGWQKFGVGYVGLFGLIAAFIAQQMEMLFVGRSMMKSTPQDKDAVTLSPAMTIEDGAVGPHSHHTENKEMTVILLEAGIMFHSVIIGLTLGVAADDEFTSLLAAICFHQLFEGMALGVMIGALNLKRIQKVALCILYPITTPVGIAIGVGVHNAFNPNSHGLILTQGILNSLSAGILFYNTYTELMSEEISHNVAFRGYAPSFKAVCFLAMYVGAAAMAILAIWA